MTKLDTQAAAQAKAAAQEKAERLAKIKASLEKIAGLEKISPELNNIVEKTISIETAEPLQEIYASIDTINRQNKQYTKHQALCIILQAYNSIKAYKEYKSKQFIINCDNLIKLSQMQSDLFFMGFCEQVNTCATSEWDNANGYVNLFQCKFTLKYCYGTKAEILENKGVQLITPTKTEQQEILALTQADYSNAYDLLTSCGFNANKLLVQQ